MENDTVVVPIDAFESVARKLSQFVEQLTPHEKEIIAWISYRAGSASSLAPHYRPRGAKQLVVGGADGLTVLFGRSGFTIWRPEGPLPLDRSGETFGGALVLGQGHV